MVKDNDGTDARVGTLLDDNRNLVTGVRGYQESIQLSGAYATRQTS